jgi:hypothetical protein
MDYNVEMSVKVQFVGDETGEILELSSDGLTEVGGSYITSQSTGGGSYQHAVKFPT